MALAHDRHIHPMPTHNHQGEPQWEGSKSEWLLKLDIDHNKQQAMEPKDLFATQQESMESMISKCFASTFIRKKVDASLLRNVKQLIRRSRNLEPVDKTS